MTSFSWSNAADILQGFGGEPVTLYVEKTGLPFYDALRLYGVIDLYIGLREDVTIEDKGIKWEITGRRRPEFIRHKDIRYLDEVKRQFGKKKPNSAEYCENMYSAIVNGEVYCDEITFTAERAFVGLDSVLQAGIRGISAANYETLQTGQTSKKECKANIPLSEGLLAFAGKKRTETASEILFLPIYEGRIDFSKVISPLRLPKSHNVLCSQVLMLLSLKTSLFAEGYHERLKAVAYSTDFRDKRTTFGFSGIININSTAIGKMKSSNLVSHAYYSFSELVKRAWDIQGKTNNLTHAAMAMAYWFMQPVGKHLSSMITAQELVYRESPYITLFNIQKKENIKEIFEMTYGNWNGDHEAVRKLAKAVASSIWVRKKDEGYEERKKNWYDEITMLRSAPSEKVFVERVLILIEQGHRELEQIGTSHRNEDFNPHALLSSIGSNRNEFEIFRDLFRMYLIQESTYKKAEDEIIIDTETTASKEE